MFGEELIQVLSCWEGTGMTMILNPGISKLKISDWEGLILVILNEPSWEAVGCDVYGEMIGGGSYCEVEILEMSCCLR
jgi:hypothetical protein